jgi:tetratricopeptide (TPR) repeat protein
MRALPALVALALLAPTPEAARAGDRAIAASHYLAARRCQEVGDWLCAVDELELAVAADAGSAELRVALAESLAMIGERDRAAAEARRAVALDAASQAATRAHVLLAQLAQLARPGDRSTAALELRQAIHLESQAADDGERPEPEPWALLAVLYLEGGDEAAAQRTLDDLAAHAPGESAAERAVGRWLADRRRPQQAERHLRRAVQADPDDADSWRLLARVHGALGRAPEVKEDLEAVLRLDPDDPEALLGLGRTALLEDDLERARALLAQYPRAAPDRAAAGAEVAAEWLASGRPDDALGTARDLLADVGPDPRLRLAEGLALKRLRRWAEAGRVLAQVRAEDGEPWVPARVALAEVLGRQGRHGAVLRALAAPLREAPGDLRLLVARAAALERAGEGAEAAAALARAAEERARLGDAAEADALIAARAAVLCRAGRGGEATAALERAVAARPRSSVLRLALADAADAAGAPARAEAELRVLLALEPDRASALARLAGLRLRGEPPDEARAEAERLARRALDLEPRAPEALEAMGRALSLRGDHGGAALALERAAAVSGGAARFEEALGDVLLAGGRARDAADAYRRALATAGEEVPHVAERMQSALARKLRDARALAPGGGASLDRARPRR